MKKSIIKLNNTGKKIKMKSGGGSSAPLYNFEQELENDLNAVRKIITREEEAAAAKQAAADKEAADKEAERKKAAEIKAVTELKAAEDKEAADKAAARRLRIAANAVQATKIMEEALNEQTNKENDERTSLSNKMNEAPNLQVLINQLKKAKEEKNKNLIDETLDYTKQLVSQNPIPEIHELIGKIRKLAQELQKKNYSSYNQTVYDSIFNLINNIVTNIHKFITQSSSSSVNENGKNFSKIDLFNQLVDEFNSDRSKIAALDKPRTGNDPSGSRGRRSIGRSNGRSDHSRSGSRGRRSIGRSRGRRGLSRSGSSGPSSRSLGRRSNSRSGPSVNSPGLNRGSSGPIGPSGSSGTSKPRDLSAELSNLSSKKLVKKDQINRSISNLINHEAIKQTISSEKLTYGESSLKNRINEFKKVYLETNADLETIVDELERLRSDIIPRIDKEYKREISTQISNIIKNIKSLKIYVNEYTYKNRPSVFQMFQLTTF